MLLHRARVDIISPLVAHFQPVYTSHTNAYATLNYAFTLRRNTVEGSTLRKMSRCRLWLKLIVLSKRNRRDSYQGLTQGSNNSPFQLPRLGTMISVWTVVAILS